MEQHPIPQQISSYEFKLVGEMTLKQFLKAAVGIVIALIINSTKLFFLVKWPLMILFGGGGLMLAFVPFEDRPLETWMAAFIKSIYSPTIFTYKKKANENWLDIDLNKILQKTEEDEQNEIETNLALTNKTTKVSEFIESLPSVKRANTEKTEKKTIPSLVPFPEAPEIPNLLVGIVTDNAGKIVEDAIIEIQDTEGNPSRVLKTNSLGQFKTSTQLTNGKYLIITEKENKKFGKINIELTGKIIEPINIKATG